MKKLLIILILVPVLVVLGLYFVKPDMVQGWVESVAHGEKSSDPGDRKDKGSKTKKHRARGTLVTPEVAGSLFVDGRPVSGPEIDLGVGTRLVTYYHAGLYDHQLVDIRKGGRSEVRLNEKSVQLESGWRNFRGDLLRTGLVSSSFNRPLTPAWQVELGASVEASPVLGSDRIYLSTAKHLAVAVDMSSGAVIWEAAGIGSSVTPVLVDGFVVAADHSGQLMAYRDEDGKAKGEIHLNSYATSLTAIGNETLVVTTRDGRALAIHCKQGFGGKLKLKLSWERELNGLSGSSASPIVTADTVILSTSRGLVALRQADGHLRWPKVEQSQGTEGHEMTLDFVEEDDFLTPTPVCDGQWIYSFYQGGLEARSVATGEIRWRTEWDLEPTSSLAFAWGMIYCGAADGKLYAFSGLNGSKYFPNGVGRFTAAFVSGSTG